MKALKRNSFILLVGLLVTFEATAQVVIRNPKRTAERQAENRANRRIDQTIDKGFDKLEEGIGSIFKKKDKKKKKDNDQDERDDDRRDNDNGNDNDRNNGGGRMSGSDMNGNAGNDAPVEPEKAAFASYSKFDFVPGEKIVALDDFSQDALGDFPAQWNTNSSGEIVTIEGLEGRWLMIQKAKGSYIPDFVKELPENFTFEYDFVYNGIDNEYAYQQELSTVFHEVEKNDLKIGEAAAGRGAIFRIAASTGGRSGVSTVYLSQTDNEGRKTDLAGQRKMSSTFSIDNNGRFFHVAIWRQKQRLRVYIDEEKVFDLPRIFPEDIKLNAMRFFGSMSRPDDQFFIANVRLAVGAPDTRSKLITEGKFVTTGITFDVNSANIKPESYAVLKDIAETLQENASVKVKIIGHTDSDGEAAANLELSKKRAESIKENLATQFGIDKSRLETDGMGEIAPAADNKTSEGKANNRRVEFVKM